MKRCLSFSLLLLLLCMMTGPVLAKTIITHYNYPGHGQSWTDYLLDRAKVFNANQTDIQVEVITASNTNEYGTKFAVMLAGGTAPDVTDFHPALGAPYIINGTFADLRPYLERDGVNLLRLTSPAVMSVLTANTGAIWGVPADIFPVVTFYNETLFDQAGLPYPKDLGNKWT